MPYNVRLLIASVCAMENFEIPYFSGRDPVTSNPVAITPMLPNFEPIINAKPAGEQEILQDILLNRGDGWRKSYEVDITMSV